jgi:hypothetical protein
LDIINIENILVPKYIYIKNIHLKLLNKKNIWTKVSYIDTIFIKTIIFHSKSPVSLTQLIEQLHYICRGWSLNFVNPFIHLKSGILATRLLDQKLKKHFIKKSLHYFFTQNVLLFILFCILASDLFLKITIYMEFYYFDFFC